MSCAVPSISPVLSAIFCACPSRAVTESFSAWNAELSARSGNSACRSAKACAASSGATDSASSRTDDAAHAVADLQAEFPDLADSSACQALNDSHTPLDVLAPQIADATSE